MRESRALLRLNSHSPKMTDIVSGSGSDCVALRIHRFGPSSTREKPKGDCSRYSFHSEASLSLCSRARFTLACAESNSGALMIRSLLPCTDLTATPALTNLSQKARNEAV